MIRLMVNRPLNPSIARGDAMAGRQITGKRRAQHVMTKAAPARAFFFKHLKSLLAD